MVYSRATTSLIAERDFFGAGVVFFGVVEGLSFAIVEGFLEAGERWCQNSGKTHSVGGKEETGTRHSELTVCFKWQKAERN